MEKRVRFVIDLQGRPVIGASIQVRQYPGGGVPTIYSDDGVTPTPTTMLSVAPDGRYQYYAPNGRYTETITTNLGETVINDILFDEDLTSNQQFVVATGTGDAMVVAAFSSGYTLTDGDEIRVRAIGANTVANPTIQLPGVGTLTIYRGGGKVLKAYNIVGSGHELVLRYRATPARMELVNPVDDVLDIKIHFGAVCDGVTDDTAAVLAAIAATGGGTLHWSGTPKITSALTISAGRHVFTGRLGINSSNRPGSYIIKAASMTTEAIAVTGSAILVGGGVVAEEGNTSSNIRISANSVRWNDGYSENAGAHGWFIDGAANNSNHCTLEHCRSYGNTTHGFYITGDDANAATLLNCFAQANGGDGFFSEKTEAGVNPAWNTFQGCAAESNTGYGIRLKGGTDNAIIGGDYETNTAGDIFIDATEQYTTLINQNRGSVITDNGFYTRRLDRYRDKRGTFHAALRGAGGATLTATDVTISGTTATITSAGHGMANGNTVFHLNFSNANLNGAFQISNVTANTYDITYRTDASATAPVNQSGLTVTIQRCGTLTTARGDYVIEAGVCEAWGMIVTSAVTNITGTVQIVLPFDGLAVGADHNSIVSVDYHAGITYTGRLACLLAQTIAARVANLYDTISGAPGVPAQLQGTGLAAVTTIIFHARYRIGDSH